MDRGAWLAVVHGVAKSQTRLSDFTFTFHFHALEEEMATHSSVLAWRIPGTGEPGGLPSLGLHRVGHDWSDLAAAVAAIWQHTLVFLPGEPQGKYKKTKIYDPGRWAPQDQMVSNISLEKCGETAPERMKWRGQSGKDADLWMCLGVKVKSDAVKNNIA